MVFKLNNIDDFRIKEKEITKVFYSQYGGFCNYFENDFKLYLKFIKSFNETEWLAFRWEKRYCLITLVKLVSNFKSSYELTITGYYPESIILTRSIYEAFLRLLFMQKFPERAEEHTGNRFKIKNVEQSLGIEEGSLYHIMSEFAHGNKIDVFSDLVYTSQGTKTGISGGPQYPDNSDWFASSMNSLMFYFWAILALLPKNQPEFQQDQVLLKQYEKQMKDFEHVYIRTYVNKAGKPSKLATLGVDEVLNIIRNLPNWS